jgi:hypothetical protein
MKVKITLFLLVASVSLFTMGNASAFLVPYHAGMFANTQEPPPPETERDDEIVELIAEYLDEETGEVTRVFVTRKGTLIYQKFGLYNGTHSVTYYPAVSGPYDDSRGDTTGDSCDWNSEYGCGY